MEIFKFGKFIEKFMKNLRKFKKKSFSENFQKIFGKKIIGKF